MVGNFATVHSMTLLDWIRLWALSMLWGGSFFFVAIALKELPSLTIVVVRLVLAAVTLVAVQRLYGAVLPADRRVWIAFFAMGLLNNVIPFSLIAWGQMTIASGVAAILNATTPLFTVVVAQFLTADERMTRGRIIGVVLGLAGVVVMVGEEALMSFGMNVLAQLAVLAAALSYALAGVFGRRFAALGVAPLATATGQLMASSMLLLPVMLIVDRPWTLSMPSAGTAAALAGLAVLSTAVAYVLYFRILASAGATNVLLVTFLIPLTALLLGVHVLGETLQARHLLGMTLIAIGLAVTAARRRRSEVRPQRARIRA